MATTDNRPRFNYRIPDGGVVAIIYDHGELPKTEIAYQMLGGKIVAAKLVSLTPHYPDGHERDLNGCIVRARANAAADDAQANAIDDNAIDEAIRMRWREAQLSVPAVCPTASPPCHAHTRATRRPAAYAVSNHDTPPCYALKCPNCGDIDTLIATDIRVTKVRGNVDLEIVELKCRECGNAYRPPTEIS